MYCFINFPIISLSEPNTAIYKGGSSVLNACTQEERKITTLEAEVGTTREEEEEEKAEGEEVEELREITKLRNCIKSKHS